MGPESSGKFFSLANVGKHIKALNLGVYLMSKMFRDYSFISLQVFLSWTSAQIQQFISFAVEIWEDFSISPRQEPLTDFSQINFQIAGYQRQWAIVKNAFLKNLHTWTETSIKQVHYRRKRCEGSLWWMKPQRVICLPFKCNRWTFFFLFHAGIKDQRTLLFYVSCNKNFPVYFFSLRRIVTFFPTQLRV